MPNQPEANGLQAPLSPLLARKRPSAQDLGEVERAQKTVRLRSCTPEYEGEQALDKEAALKYLKAKKEESIFRRKLVRVKKVAFFLDVFGKRFRIRLIWIVHHVSQRHRYVYIYVLSS
jgi:hypothetical protein